MARSSPSITASLPRGWSKRVRSGVIHAISLARLTLTATHGWGASSRSARIRLKVENQRLRQEVGLLREEIRIKDARMLRVPGIHRPHYQPVERLSILELRAARGWSLTETADRLHVTTTTVSSWMHRLDERGPAAIARIPQPANRYPDYIRYFVQRLKVHCPTLGYAKIAQVLCRVGLHLSATTVRRMQREGAAPRLPPAERKAMNRRRSIREPMVSHHPNHAWLCDFSAVPTSFGFWTAWIPFAVPQCWPFCWWVAVAVDHHSRRIMGIALFRRLPSSSAVRTFLGRVIRIEGSAPEVLITDRGRQFTEHAFGSWCRQRSIGQRFGALGQSGSIAVTERLIQTLKRECTCRLVLVPYLSPSLRRELGLFRAWYNEERPHETLAAATPDEIFHGREPACRRPRFEPRPQGPRGSPHVPRTGEVRGRPGARLELRVSYLAGRKHLPIVALGRAA